MGLFKRAASAANTVDVATDLTVALSPSVRRVRKLEERGTPANGVITGVKFTLNDDMTRKDFAVTALESGARYGIRASLPDAHRLRLGLPVVVKADGARAVFEWAAMAAAWELGDEFLGQDSLRKAPDDGIHDAALDARVQLARVRAHEGRRGSASTTIRPKAASPPSSNSRWRPRRR